MTLSFGTISFIAILVIIFSLTIYSCNSSVKSSDNQTINIDRLTVSPEVHDSLNTDQTTKVKKIYITFSEVNPSTLEETISNFKRDQYPDNEINVWLNMAKTYENFISTRTSKLDLNKKKEVYKLILIR